MSSNGPHQNGDRFYKAVERPIGYGGVGSDVAAVAFFAPSTYGSQI